MKESKLASFLAIDLGASSGRAILGTIENGKLELTEINRFANPSVMFDQSLLAKRQAIPEFIFNINDQASRHYLIGLFAILADVRCLMAHTSQSIMNIIQTILKNSDDMIHDIIRGNIRRQLDISELERETINTLLEKRMKTKKVEFLKNVHFIHRSLPLNVIWPKMRLICFWMHGAAGVYKSTIGEYFPNSHIRSYPYLANEGWISFPKESYLQDGVLNLKNNFFEFLELDEHNNTIPIALTSKYLQEEHHYQLLVTNFSGLYRYKVGDIVTVTAFDKDAPRLVYAQSVRSFCNLSGENLSEIQVEKAFNEAIKGLEDRFNNLWVMFPEFGNSPRYRLFIEKKRTMEISELKKFLTVFEKAICRKSALYAEKRKQGLLLSVELYVCSPNSFNLAQKKRQVASNLPLRFSRFFTDQSQIQFFEYEQKVSLDQG